MTAIAIGIHDFINTLREELQRLELVHLDTRVEDMHVAAAAGDVDELRRLVRVRRSEALREIGFMIEDVASFDPARADALRRQAVMFGAAHA